MISQMPLNMQEFLENRNFPTVNEIIRAAMQYLFRRQTEPLQGQCLTSPFPKESTSYSQRDNAEQNHQRIPPKNPQHASTPNTNRALTIQCYNSKNWDLFSKNCPQRCNRPIITTTPRNKTYQAGRNQCQGN